MRKKGNGKTIRTREEMVERWKGKQIIQLENST